MAYEAFEIDDIGIEQIVCADDPTLDPYKVYRCSGTDRNGKRCLCPVHLVLGSEHVSPHFRQAFQDQKHISGCSHAEESPYHQIMHLDLSGQGWAEEDLLDIGSRDDTESRRKDKQLPQNDPDNQDRREERDTGDDDRPLQVVHKKPTNIRQLYLILSLPEVMAYAGHKIVELLVSSKTIQYHRNHLPMKDGVKLVVAEACFAKDMIPPGRNTVLMQDPYWKEGGKKVSEEKRIRYVIQVTNAQHDSIHQLLKDAKGKRYLILGDWRYDEATHTYRCALNKKSHWILLKADFDCESF